MFSTEIILSVKMSSWIAVKCLGISSGVIKSAQLKQVYILQHFMYATISSISNH